ncbi:trypsin-like serine peptidase [Nocardioides ungokensis]|uniref:trypsin-like serine peptidase n=1 Tax=Nocardioides ungokensis TaxID=1643322 RepID=UPI0015DF1EAE|nr:serine protease [Nocardioides ungokensis]
MDTAWFEDLPLDWTRPVVRDATAAIVVGYPMTNQIMLLAKNAGLATGSIDFNGPIKFVVRDVLEKARLADRLEQLLFEVFADPEVGGLHEALRKTMRGHEAKVQAAALARRPSLDLLGRLPADVAVQGETGTETLLNAMAAFEDPALFRSRLAASEVRVCQVVVGGEAAGSGFLVGPQHILTNWHVAQSLGGPGRDGVALFDHKRDTQGAVVNPGRPVPFAADWKVASSGFAADSVELSPEGPAMGLFDYALVQLSEPVGSEGIAPDHSGDPRGSFALSARTTPISADEPLWVLGHPSTADVQFPLLLSFASPSGANLSTNLTRLRYKMNTKKGSSGSVVLDRNFDAVALHHFGGATDNQGVPIGLVVEDVRKQVTEAAVRAQIGL